MVKDTTFTSLRGPKGSVESQAEAISQHNLRGNQLGVCVRRLLRRASHQAPAASRNDGAEDPFLLSPHCASFSLTGFGVC